VRILVLEDNETLAAAICRFLRFLGHDVRGAANLCEARLVLAEERIELLLADVQLPDGLGTDLLLDLRPDCRMVTMSGLEMQLPKVRDSRWRAHLPKPVTPEDLEAMLQRETGEGRRPRRRSPEKVAPAGTA
jgi:two-component system response regulator PilR (NtrC family)